MRIEGEHACTLWPETACSPLPRTRAQLCPGAEALLCYRTCPHSAIFISTTVVDAGAVSWRPLHPRRCPHASCDLNVSACQTRRPRRVLSVERPPVVARAPRPGSRPRHAGAPLGARQPGPPPAVARLLWWGSRPGKGPHWETRGYGAGRSPLVPWGEIPLYLGEKYPCTLGRNTLVPLGEVALDLEAKPPCTLGRNNMT
jgi:hypothetical protein